MACKFLLNTLNTHKLYGTRCYKVTTYKKDLKYLGNKWPSELFIGLNHKCIIFMEL